VTRILDTVYGEPVGNRRARKFPVGDDPEKNRRNDPGFWCGSVRWRSRAGSSAFASRMASAGSWRTRLSAPAILKYNPEHGTTAAALTSYSLRLLCWSDRSGRGNAHDEHHEGGNPTRCPDHAPNVPNGRRSHRRWGLPFQPFRACPMSLHIYNCGTVGSTGVTAFLGVDAARRYTSAHGTFVIHKARLLTTTPADAVLHRAFADKLVIDDRRSEEIIRKNAPLIPADRCSLVHSGRDVVFNAQEAVKFGITKGIHEFNVPAGEKLYNI
jgi:hypothetical protein